MMVERVENREEWNNHLVQSSDDHQFLQSWEWGEFQAAVGHTPCRLRIETTEGSIAQLQAVAHTLPLGFRYWYVPRCPSLGYDERKIFFQYLGANNVLFTRVESVSAEAPTGPAVFSTAHRQPAHTLVIDIAQTDEVLLAAMHTKTRYNIGLAQRKGVEIRDEKNLDVFWQLHEHTMQRDKFRGHPRSYYEAMLKSDIVHQLIAYYENRPIATIVLVLFGNTITYLHGASSDLHREVMAPHLLQWEAMQLGKRHDCTRYDLWGVSPPAAADDADATSFHTYRWRQEDRLSRVTRFKAGFGGELISYGAAYEWVYHPRLYSAYRIAKRFL